MHPAIANVLVVFSSSVVFVGGLTSSARASDSVEKAKSLLVEMARAYREAPTIADRVEWLAPTRQGSMQKVEAQMHFGPGDASKFSMGPARYTTLDRNLYFEFEGAPTRYLRIAFEGTVLDGFDALSAQMPGSSGLPPFPQFALRYASDVDAYVHSFGFGSPTAPQIVGFERVNTDSGPAHELVFESDVVKTIARVDAESKLLISITRIATRGQAAGNETTYAFHPRVADRLDTPIDFDAGDREELTQLQEMFAPPVAVKVGQPAPDFTLTALDGESVTLSELRGSVVVLDFWATWCHWCIKGMPKLDEFAQWAESSGQPIKVFGINTLERTPPERTRENVEKFWTNRGFAFPTLLDLNQAVVGAYGFRGIPATVIVDPQGNIHEIHNGFDPDMAEKLKRESAQALQHSG